MKANELRIGNFVTIDNPKHHPSIKGQPLIVLAIDEIDEPKCSLICTDPKENLIIPAYSQFLKFIQPIPLTAEWLERLGLMRSPLSILIYEKEKDAQFAIKEWNVGSLTEWLVFWGERRLGNLEITHVHQLQNLYFALTGKELTMKEETK